MPFQIDELTKYCDHYDLRQICCSHPVARTDAVVRVRVYRDDDLKRDRHAAENGEGDTVDYQVGRWKVMLELGSHELLSTVTRIVGHHNGLRRCSANNSVEAWHW